jgi:dolichyl-phosphate beta-glucosyltransferase
MQKICIIIPCYNEAGRLDVKRLCDFMDTHPDCSFMGVNDGSTDNTLPILEDLAKKYPAQFVAFNMPANGGKAEAVRHGLLQAHKAGGFDYYGYWDADFSTALEEIDWFIYFSEGKLTHKIIIGSRIARLGANVDRKMLRHYLGRIFATSIANILRIRIYDSQCGAKLVQADIVERIFTEPFISRWFFDVEVFFRFIKKMNGTSKDILEVPLRAWREIGGSKLKLSDFFKAPYELWRINRYYR